MGQAEAMKDDFIGHGAISMLAELEIATRKIINQYFPHPQ
jgi:hypothetical protein